MTMQSLCHGRSVTLTLMLAAACSFANARADSNPHDYPTAARVEYVHECMAKHGGEYATLHQCSCAIDAIAKRLRYDQYVEAATFARYSTMGGDGGGIFRDSEHAKTMAKMYRSVEAEAQAGCGLSKTRG
jgi:hypothetical protein